MMMLDEDQISFCSDSLMFDGIEDYSHQIAEMIGLRNESYFIQVGDIKASTVVGANILKDGTDPKVMEDSQYPEWLWHLLDKKPALSELQRKKVETLPYEQLKRFFKLDNRARIKDNNSIKAKN